MMGWFLYLIECADGALYTGIALDVEARYQKHCAGKGAKYTRANKPVRLIGKIAYPDRGTATQAEIAFKKLSRMEKQARIPEFAPALSVSQS
ncbi:MAG TPA: GIY-YIG nuclease family protein [Dongiaceae bacterium]|jgi:putative endonuclease